MKFLKLSGRLVNMAQVQYIQRVPATDGVGRKKGVPTTYNLNFGLNDDLQLGPEDTPVLEAFLKHEGGAGLIG